jgi:putative aldouronate transport system permease protein
MKKEERKTADATVQSAGEMPHLARLPLRPKASSSNNKFGGLDVFIFIILLLYVIIVIFPFYYAFTISISSEHAYNNSDLLLWPQEVTLEAYKLVFTNAQLWNGFGITMILLVFGTAYQLFFTVITGYAMSRDKWFGKNFVMNMIIVTMFFGGGLVPYYYLITSLGLYNTIWVMIIPGAIDTFNMLLMRNYFASLPKELEESAKMDGANDVQIFVKVYLPLSLPMLATIGLFFAVGNWNSWYNGMLFIENSSLKPLQLVLREMIASISSNVESPTTKTYSEGLVMASIFFTIVPMMCFYPFLQKFFVRGIVVGAIKG